MAFRSLHLTILTILTLAGPASGRDDPQAVFALIVGVNRPIDANLNSLRYADDDAARYFDLFRSLGARTYLLTRPDTNTLRLHTQAAAEALKPRMGNWDASLNKLQQDVLRARTRGVESVLYFVYAGHGNVEDGRGYLTLEDGRLTGQEIDSQVVSGVNADRVHLVVDACYSYLLVHARGPGGERRPLHGFSGMRRLVRHDHVGFLLSTSAARESHEWESFQAGVFSHEVRSGLYGAADADGDGRIRYREIAAFVQRANAAIPNERFRPQVFARPPSGTDVLLDIRQGLERRLEIEPEQHGRYLLEDIQGIRLVDFHSAPGQPVRLLRPVVYGSMYLRPVSGSTEYLVPANQNIVRLASVSASTPRTEHRGALHHAFGKLFAWPFDRQVVEGFAYPQPDLTEVSVLAHRVQATWRRVAGWGALGLGAAAAMSGIVLRRTAGTIRNQVGPANSHLEVSRLNDRIDDYNSGAVVLYSISGALLASGLLLLLWPEDASKASVIVSEEGAFFSLGGEF